MTPLTTKNLKARMIKAGFTVRDASQGDGGDDCIMAPMRATMRKQSLAYQVGRRMIDSMGDIMDIGSAVEFGTTEATARCLSLREFAAFIGNPRVSTLPAAYPMWLCGPGARWVATGTSEHLDELSKG